MNIGPSISGVIMTLFDTLLENVLRGVNIYEARYGRVSVGLILLIRCTSYCHALHHLGPYFITFQFTVSFKIKKKTQGNYCVY